MSIQKKRYTTCRVNSLEGSKIICHNICSFLLIVAYLLNNHVVLIQILYLLIRLLQATDNACHRVFILRILYIYLLFYNFLHCQAKFILIQQNDSFRNIFQIYTCVIRFLKLTVSTPTLFDKRTSASLVIVLQMCSGYAVVNLDRFQQTSFPPNEAVTGLAK